MFSAPKLPGGVFDITSGKQIVIPSCKLLIPVVIRCGANYPGSKALPAFRV